MARRVRRSYDESVESVHFIGALRVCCAMNGCIPNTYVASTLLDPLQTLLESHFCCSLLSSF